MAKEEGGDKFTRLLQLVALLEYKEHPLPLSEIRERFPGFYTGNEAAALRKFNRDKADLRAMGVPLLTETIPGSDPPLEGYVVRHKGRAVADPDLTPAELAALHVAAAALSLRSAEPGELTDATGGLRKLGGLGPRSREASGAELTIDRNVDTAFAAILAHHVLAFTYRGSTRRVTPHQLFHEGGHWYLLATPVDAAEVRTYRVDRFEGTALGPQEFGDEAPGPAAPAPVPREELRFRPWEFGDGESTTATVRVDASVAPIVLAADDALAVAERGPDGSVVVQLEVRDRQGLWRWLLDLLDHAELLSPPELRDAYVARLRDLAGEAA